MKRNYQSRPPNEFHKGGRYAASTSAPNNITPKGSTQPPLKLPVTNNAMRQCKAEETLKELMLVLQEMISMETGEAPWWVM